jgi:hypothetical protein
MAFNCSRRASFSTLTSAERVCFCLLAALSRHASAAILADRLVVSTLDKAFNNAPAASSTALSASMAAMGIKLSLGLLGCINKYIYIYRERERERERERNH